MIHVRFFYGLFWAAVARLNVYCCFANRSSSWPPVLAATSCLLFLFCLFLLLDFFFSSFQLATTPHLSGNGVCFSCYKFILNHGKERNQLSNKSIIILRLVPLFRFWWKKKNEAATIWPADEKTSAMINEEGRQN